MFIIGHLRGSSTRKVFPIRPSNGEVNIPIKLVAHRKGYHRNTQTFSPEGITETLDTGQGGGRGHYTIVQPVLTPDRAQKRQNGRRFKDPGEPMFTLTSQDRHGVMVVGNVNPSGKGMNGQIYNSDGLSPTLTTNKGEGLKISHKPKHIPGLDGIDNTIRSKGWNTPTPKHNFDHIHDGFRIRRLTPKECWRLQGFPDWAFDKAAEVSSNSQLYKQAGNSVTVNVIYEIARKLK